MSSFRAWRKWTTDKQEADADRRGRALSLALGVSGGDPAQIPAIVLGYLRGDLRLPNADRLGEYEGGRAYGWAAAFGLLAILSNEEVKKDLTKRLELGRLILDLKNDYAFARPILEDRNARTTARRLGAELRERFGVEIVIEQLVAFWHYEQQLRRGKNIELDALVKDIATLYLHCSPTAASNTAWLIGRLMEEPAVTALLYARTASDWPTMARTDLHRNSFDVVLAAQRMQQEMANDDAADPSSNRETIGSNPADLDATAEPPIASPSLVGHEIDGILTKPATAPVKEATALTAAPVSAPLYDPRTPESVATDAIAANREADSVSDAVPHESVQEPTSAGPSAVQLPLIDENRAPPPDGTTVKVKRPDTATDTRKSTAKDTAEVPSKRTRPTAKKTKSKTTEESQPDKKDATP